MGRSYNAAPTVGAGHAREDYPAGTLVELLGHVRARPTMNLQ